MTRLPYDISRCRAENCPVRDECLRYRALSDIGPRTPMNDFSARIEIVTAEDCDHYEVVR